MVAGKLIGTVYGRCGFCMGWLAIIDDVDRILDYSLVESITISKPQVGGSGNFWLINQKP